MDSETSAAQPASAPVRATILGSCVSRDTAEAAGPERIAVSTYVARQSLASAWSDASAAYPEGTKIASRFQERQIRGDFSGDLGTRLPAAGAADLILCDLVDERHGVHELPGGTIVTRSVDALSARDVRAVLETGRRIPFGGPEHYALWSLGAVRLAEQLDSRGLLGRAVLLDIPWAVTDVNGDAVPDSMGVSAQEANRLRAPYVRRLAGLGFEVITLAEDVVLADPSHRWGLAPFHYQPAVYEQILWELGL